MALVKCPHCGSSGVKKNGKSRYSDHNFVCQSRVTGSEAVTGKKTLKKQR